ncbi:MAG: GNAT family N-acetyltransferase [Thermoanaerobaculia bacterium]
MSDLIRDAERILSDCFASFAAYPQAHVINEPAAFGVLSGIPVPFFNGIATTNLSDASDIDRMTERFRKRQTPFRWWLTPSTQPHDLEAQLIARGFHHTYDANGMVADYANVSFDGIDRFDIRRIDNAREFDAWIDVFIETFSIPVEQAASWRDVYGYFGFDRDWAHYVGFIDNQPVTMSSLLLANDLAGIYCVGTISKARGRGIGRAVTLAAMKEGRDRGATKSVLQSSEMGYGVYKAIGFEDVCSLRLYDWRPEYER